MLAEFFAESNKIEGYDFPVAEYAAALDDPRKSTETVVINTVLAWRSLLKEREEPMSCDRIGRAHFTLMRGLLPKKEAGCWRSVRVRVGTSIPPAPEHIDLLMRRWVDDYNAVHRPLDALTLHKEFERIHPFVDGNGRMGRMLYALDLLTTEQPIEPILSLFTGVDFYERRAAYYKALGEYSDAKNS